MGPWGCWTWGWDYYVSPEKPWTIGRTVCDKPPKVMLEIQKKNSKWLINSTHENVRRPQVRLFLASSSSGTCSKPRCGRLGMVPGNRPTAPLRSRPLKSLGQWSGGRDISVISLGHPLADPYILLFFFVFYSCPSPSWVSPSWPILDTLQTKTSLESRLSHF